MNATSVSLTAEPILEPRPAGGRWPGLGNLVSKEFGRWWTTRRWLIHALLWLTLIDGISSIVMAFPDGMGTDEHLVESVYTFFGLGVIALGIGIVVSVQGSIIGEKELGTAAWIMSKPVSRASFVLAKLVAETASFLIVGVLVPAVGFFVASRLLLPVPLDPGRFAAGVGVSALAATFYVTLSLALGALFSARGPVAGIGIGLILLGQVLKNVVPPSIFLRTPWALPEVATSVAVPLPMPIEGSPLAPIAITLALTIALAALAIWRFRREEL